jgi:hypothetical protein
VLRRTVNDIFKKPTLFVPLLVGFAAPHHA